MWSGGLWCRPVVDLRVLWDVPVTRGLDAGLHLDVGSGVSLEGVDKFCCLGDLLDADGGCGSAVAAAVGSAWRGFMGACLF